MTFRGFLSAALVSVCWVFVSATATRTPLSLNISAPLEPAASTSSTGSSTRSRGTSSPKDIFKGLGGVDSSMIQRALYVLIGFTMIGVLYFLIRAVRLKKPAQKKKYGLLSNYEDSVEMEAVESDEDDTLYEARSLRR